MEGPAGSACFAPAELLAAPGGLSERSLAEQYPLRQLLKAVTRKIQDAPPISDVPADVQEELRGQLVDTRATIDGLLSQLSELQ